MKYRKEIDGLRVFAIIPVLLFHAGFDLFQDGFVGIDDIQEQLGEAVYTKLIVVNEVDLDIRDNLNND